MYNDQSFSVAWGSPTERATEEHRPFATNADAKAARDAAYRALPSFQRKRASRSVLKGQLRPYWGFGSPCGIVCDVYKIHL